MTNEELKRQFDMRLAERQATSDEAEEEHEEERQPNPVAVELRRLRGRVDKRVASVGALNRERLARKHAHEQLMDEEAAEKLRRRSARRGHIISGVIGFFVGSILAGLGCAEQQRRANQLDEQLKR